MQTVFVVSVILGIVGWGIFGRHPPRLRMLRAFRVKIVPYVVSERARFLATSMRAIERDGAFYLVACYDPALIAGSDAALAVLRDSFLCNGGPATIERANDASTPPDLGPVLDAASPTVVVERRSVRALRAEETWTPRPRAILGDGFLCS